MVLRGGKHEICVMCDMLRVPVDLLYVLPSFTRGMKLGQKTGRIPGKPEYGRRLAQRVY